MFVADRTANRIVRYDAVTGAYEGVLAEIDRPSSARLGADGMLYVAGFGQSEIVRLDPNTGATIDRFYRDTGVLEEPVELVFRADELVVLGHDTHNAIVIDDGGTMVHDVGYPDMRGAHDFTFGSDGLLYVATEHDVVLGTAMQVWDVAAGTMVDGFGTLDELANATGVAAVGRDLYVTDYERGALIRVAPDRTMQVLANGLAHPIGIELGLDGLLYVIDDAGIQTFDLDGEFQAMVVRKGPNLVGPRGIAFALRSAL